MRCQPVPRKGQYCLSNSTYKCFNKISKQILQTASAASGNKSGQHVRLLSCTSSFAIVSLLFSIAVFVKHSFLRRNVSTDPQHHLVTRQPRLYDHMGVSLANCTWILTSGCRVRIVKYYFIHRCLSRVRKFVFKLQVCRVAASRSTERLSPATYWQSTSAPRSCSQRHHFPPLTSLSVINIKLVFEVLAPMECAMTAWLT